MGSRFVSSEFWDDLSPWISLAEGQSDPADLKTFLGGNLKERGVLAFQTSGSTGTPKWVVIEKSAFLASAKAVNDHLQSDSTDRWMIPLPRHHVAGFSILARCHLSKASFQFYEGAWNAQRFIESVEQESSTLCSLVPTQVYDLVKCQRKAPKSLRAILVGGGSMMPELRAQALALGWPLLQTYGMTEASSGIATESFSEGFPEPQSELEVLPIWDLETSEEGMLIVRGEALALGYALFGEDGWRWEEIPRRGLLTRDRVELLQCQGKMYLKFLGRDSSFVKVKGELLHLGALQERLDKVARASGFIGEAVILALPDERREERLILAVADEVSEDSAIRELLEAYHQEASPFEKLHEIRRVPILPRSDLGKVKMESLKQMILESEL